MFDGILDVLLKIALYFWSKTFKITVKVFKINTLRFVGIYFYKEALIGHL